MIVETSEAVEALKSKLISMDNAHKKTYKRFWYSWGSVKSEEDHEKRRLHNDRLGADCFIHLLGAPQKDGKDMPLLPYQKLLHRMLHEKKQIWIKKSRGIGVTTFFLYWIAYCCVTTWKPGDRVCVVVGPRINLAEDWITRFKNLFTRNFPGVYSELNKQASTVAILNNVKVEAFPSHHVDTMRGLDNVKFIMVDEADYFPPFQQKQVRAVCEGYLGKPNSDDLTIVLASTPNAPGGLLQQIELEPNSIYYKFFLDYRLGLEGDYPIYSKEQIEKARKSPDFPREFEGKYLGIIGNIFSISSIERAVKLGDEKYSYVTDTTKWHKDIHTLLAIDPAYGSTSKYGIVMTQYIDGRIVVIYAQEYTKPDYSDMISEVSKLSRLVGSGRGEGVSNILVDSSAPEVIASLRREFRKDQYLEQYINEVVANCKKYNTPIEKRLFVVPKNFRESRQMLQHAVMLMDDPQGLVAIPSKYQDLIVSLRTASAEEWKLDKPNSSHNDLLDTLLMALSVYKFRK